MTPTHRATCADCPWTEEGEDLLELSDEMERHARKEQHDVDLQRAVATDGGRCADGTERYEEDVAECEECGEEIDFTEETVYWITANDRFWHDGCHDPTEKLDRVDQIREDLLAQIVGEDCFDGLSDEFHNRLDDIQSELDEAVRKERLQQDQDLASDGGFRQGDRVTVLEDSNSPKAGETGEVRRQEGEHVVVTFDDGDEFGHAAAELLLERQVRTDGGYSLENGHHCEICDTAFDTIAKLIEHDCEDDREYAVMTDGGVPGDSVGLVECPTCSSTTPLEEAHQTGKCSSCGESIPDDAPTKIRRDVVDDRGWDKLHGADYEPAGGVDYAQDEISKPDRDVEAVTEVLTTVENGDTVEATIGAAEADATTALYVFSHERDVAGFDHRLMLLESPGDDGWCRAYFTGLGSDSMDPWEVASAPYHLEGDQTLDMRDFASNGWVIDAELVEDTSPTPVTDGGVDDVYRDAALRQGRPSESCGCAICTCQLHTFPDDEECIWCRNGQHRAATDGGAVDNDFDDAELPAEEQIGVDDSIQTEPIQGGIAFDLVKRQPLFVVRKKADTLAEFYEEEDFDLLSYSVHPYLPVRADDAVFECVFLSDVGVEQLTGWADAKTYDYPRGRLAHVPIEQAWGGDDGDA